MTLTYGIEGPRDVLAKARRERDRLERALKAQVNPEISDALFNFSVTVFHVQDWLIKCRAGDYTQEDVKTFIHSDPAIRAFHDLCTQGKHNEIKWFDPVTASITSSSVGDYTLMHLPMTEGSIRPFVVKHVALDGTKQDILKIADDALTAWERFFEKYNVA